MRTTLRVLLVALLITAGAAHAQNYRFSIPEAEVTVTVEKAGTATIHYKLTFACAGGASPIDVVDIGMPNTSSHAPGGALINGHKLPRNSIRISTYLKPHGCGYEVHLGNHAIRPGQTGVFEFTARETRMVWQDTTNPDQVSFRFSPTWFGAKFVTGQTNFVLRYKLPIPAADYPSVKDRILWHRKGQEFSKKGIMEGENVASVAWARQVRMTGPREYGVSFPKKYVENVRKDTLFGVFLRWFKGNKDAQVISGIVLVFLFVLVFFAGTRGTGWSVFLVLTGLMIFIMVKSPALHLALYPTLLALVLMGWLFKRRLKKHYFPARVCREGGGIRRGFTSVEAAVLLELPLNKVLTMIIFSLAKRGIVHVKNEDPLRLEVFGSFKNRNMWLLPDGKLVKLWPYHHAFLEAFQLEQFQPVEAMDLDDAFDALIKRVAKGMEGFSLELTRDYYRAIVKRAWLQVESEGGYEAQMGRMDRNLGWLMLDDNWEEGLHRTGYGHRYYPHWWYHTPYHHHAHGRPAPLQASAATPEPTQLTGTFADVVHSLTGRFEHSCASMMGRLDNVSANTSGGIDLSAFDRFTANMLADMASGSGGGGGAGGGCACAGCACACACAGGGR